MMYNIFVNKTSMNKEYLLLKKALEISRECHKNQKDKAGDDYIFHPILVALQCSTINEKIVALLHDCIEDHPDKINFITLSEIFPSEIIEALKLLTHVKNDSIQDDHQEYRAYIEKIKESNNKIAINVKIADLTNNSDFSRLNGNKPKKYDDYIWALKYLND